MTPQEAINIIEDITWQDNGRHDEKIVPAREIAISALEKQIPKKPFKEVIVKKNTRMVCPVCFVNLHYLVEQQNYCPDCGQALDWSDTE